jgi:chorismate synthase
MDIYFKVAFKPTSTIFKEQETIDTAGNSFKLQLHGRHDPCVLPRAVPIVEAMTAIVLADHLLRNRSAKI